MIRNLLTVTFGLLAASALAAGPQLRPAELAVPTTESSSLRLSSEDTPSRRNAADDSEWKVIGKGTYKDVLFSDYFNLPQQTFSVTFEQNVDDPTVYRIPNVYENMDFSAYGDNLRYDPANATPMVFRIFYDDYAYFEEFDTGVFMDHGSNVGEIHMLMQGPDFLAYNSIETIIYYLPECLLSVQNGNFTLGSTFVFEGRELSNVLGLVFVTGTSYDNLFRANTKGNFLVTLPDADDYDPNADWWDLGMATYTDSFTEAFYSSNPVYGTWEVKMQQNRYDQNVYRLVNPYAGWENPFTNIHYDNSTDYYLTLITQDVADVTLVGIPTFRTGLSVDGYGAFSVSNQVANYLNDVDFFTIYSNYPASLGMLEDGVITYPGYCMIDYEMYLNFYAYMGNFNIDGQFYSANSQGNFKIVMPKEGAAVKDIVDSDAAPEYFNLQGVKVSNPVGGEMVIERRGGKARIIIAK